MESNIKFQDKVQKIEAKSLVMRQELERLSRSSQAKKYTRNKCDLDWPSFNRSPVEENGDEGELCMEALKVDVEKLSKFIIACVPKSNPLSRSYSAAKMDSYELE